jgi:hypothetical protein
MHGYAAEESGRMNKKGVHRQAGPWYQTGNVFLGEECYTDMKTGITYAKQHTKCNTKVMRPKIFMTVTV